ncbi:MAG: MoxR family ATPase [Bacillota bacterium]|nr:MoxR family ATPase [Bacillota bacterium]
MADIQAFGEALLQHVGKTLVDQEETALLMAVGLLAEGHILLEDVPGVGKTRLAQTVAQSMAGATFRRIQFTPDLLPSDVIGVNMFHPGEGQFTFRPGPIFAHVVLADEINRATPRTQAALLEAMQERQVSSDGVTRPLPTPFFVLATQNPVEQEGTFPLPEAQLDRFLLRLTPGYPTDEAEREMLARVARREGAEDVLPSLRPVVAAEELPRLAQAAREVEVHPDVQGYVVDLVRASRTQRDIRLGASPRAAIALLRAAQALAALRGRPYVVPEDVSDLAVPVLAHRLILSPEAELEGKTGAGIVRDLLQKVPAPTEAH